MQAKKKITLYIYIVNGNSDSVFCYGLGVKNQEIAWLLQEKYAGVKSAAFHADCERLATGEPLAYIIGSIPFLDCKIYLDSHPLIPRPETEYWVEKAITVINYAQASPRQTIQNNCPRRGLGQKGLSRPAFNDGDIRTDVPGFVPRKDDGVEEGDGDIRRLYEEHNDSGVTWQSKMQLDERGLSLCGSQRRMVMDEVLRILDLCAGSGVIGVAVARAVPDVGVTFAEINPTLLPTIEKNLSTNIAINRNIGETSYKILQSDLFENVTGKFDFILTNPPYIDADAQTVDKSVITNEPHLALFGGQLGLELIARIITAAPAYLTPAGQLWIEHEPLQTEAIATLGAGSGFIVTTYPDQYGTLRYSVLTKAVAK